MKQSKCKENRLCWQKFNEKTRFDPWICIKVVKQVRSPLTYSNTYFVSDGINQETNSLSHFKISQS